MSVQSTTGAIVAGGRASRFGGNDKSRLLIDGRTIIVRQVEILQRVASELLVVAPDGDRFADLPVRVVPDRQPGRGVVGGIDAALHAARGESVVTIACDLPFLTADLLGYLVELAQGHDGAWVRTERGAEPLAACYRRSARTRVAEFLDSGGRRASDLAQVLDLAELTSPTLDRFGDPARLLLNVNTPGDYARVQYRPE